MDEPPSKKARAESDYDGDGLDALSELEKLETLSNSGTESENPNNASTSANGGSGGPSGSTPSNQGPASQMSNSNSGFNMTPTPQNPPVTPSAPGSGSVLQELLMNQPQGTNNSPRPPNQGYPTGPQGTAFTRSPLLHNGTPTMMSPPNSMAGRVPGPSPVAAQQPGAQNMRAAGQPGMYPPGVAEGQMMMGAQGQQYPAGMMHRGYPPFGQNGPQGAAGLPAGYPGPGGRGAGAIGRGSMMNGGMGRGMGAQGRGGGIPGAQMMARGMMETPYGQQHAQFVGQRPDATFMQGYGRGTHQHYQMLQAQQQHQQMMMDANGQPIRGPNGQAMMMPLANGNHPGMPHGSQAAAAAAAAQHMQAQQGQQQAAAQQAAHQHREQEQLQNQRNGRATTPGSMISLLHNQQDPEKRKLIQQQLVLLLHAHKCQQRERENQEGRGNSNGQPHAPCTLPHCSTMKEVLVHMTHCNNGRACQFPHCASSRQIIAHWKNCNRDDCPVCKPLKKIQDNPMNFTLNSDYPNSVGNGNGSTNNNGNEGMGQFGSPTMRGGITNSLFEGYNGDPFRLPNAPNQKLGPFGTHRMERGGQADIPNLPPPDCPDNAKEWHLQVTKDLRNHLVGKLVKAIFPEPDPNAVNDNRLKDLICYARKVEKEMFESANDREEYYHLLAEKIYKIQKELQEKKNSRLNQGHAHPDQFSNIPGHAELAEIMLTDGRQPQGIDQPSTSAGPQNSMMPGSASSQQSSTAPWMSQSAMQQNTPSQQTPNANVPNAPIFNTSGSSTPNILQPASSIIPKAEVCDDEATSSSRAPSTVPCQNGAPASPQYNINMNAVKKEEPDFEPVSNHANMNMNELKPVKKEEPDAPKEPEPPREPREPTPPPAEDNVFSAEDLRMFLKPVWEKLDKSEDAVPFRTAVDPVMLNIPDYHEIVKNPMDLETINKKLDNGKYSNPWQFCDDIWLMLENAWLYNRKNSKVYKFGLKIQELFSAEMDLVMKTMGYCCSKNLSFTPLALFCYGAPMCTIARDQQYYVYETSSTQFNVVVSERYTYCTKCFEALAPEGISLSENPNDKTNMASKDKFQQMKNNVIDFEPFDKCKYCHRKWHRICALHNKKVFPEGFICDSCRASKKYPKPENRFLAKKLPHNKLSLFLEDRVNTYIRKSLQAEAHKYEVVIRTLCVQDKEVEVKAQMKTKYVDTKQFPNKFPYRTKAVFAFEIIDGVEVCFFGLHVQEYGSNCPAPNARRVYIAYLDSVHFFQPRELRTDVYHEILLGYLEYAKRLGYTMAHIWACPPSEGDDYIFHCHPPEQKIPKPKRLQDWYKKMLEKGVTEKTVVEFKDIYKQARDDNLVSPTQLPYFEGDFWPNVIEDCIREAGNEEAQRKQTAETDDMDCGEVDDGGNGDGAGGTKKSSKQNKKNNLKKNSKMNKKKQGSSTGNEIADKLYSQFEKHKEVFFTIRLVSQQTELTVNTMPINDPDPLLSSEMMDGRDTFLTRARDEHWEFSSLRRAKYSTLCLAHALHETESSKVIEYSCNKCSSMNARWHCNICDDFDLCDHCKTTTEHEHPLEKINSLVGDTTSDAPGNNRIESIQRCIQSLVHACQCRDANCRRMSCHKMKRVVQHTKMCKKRISGTCPVCKQLIALCCYHAKHCSREGCSVPFCMNIRQKLAEQKRSLARRSDMMMKRRMAGLQAGVGGGGSSGGGPSMPGGSSANNGANSNVPTPPPSSKGGKNAGMKGGGIGTVNAQQGGMGSGQQMGSMGSGVGGSSGLGNSLGMSHQMQQQQQQQQRDRFMQSGKGGGVGTNQGSNQNMFGGMQRQGSGVGSMLTPQQQQQQQQQQLQQQQQQQQREQQMRAGMNPGAMNQHFRPNQPNMMGNNMQGIMQLPTTGPQPQLADPMIQSQLAKINNRLKVAKTQEDRENVFTDLKKTPHLFNIFLRHGTAAGIQSLLASNSGIMLQQQQQIPHQPPSQQQQAQMRGQQNAAQQQLQQQQQQQQFANSQQPRGPGGQFASMSAAQQQVWQAQQIEQARRQQHMVGAQQQFSQRQMMIAQQQLQSQQHQSGPGAQ